MLFNYQFAPLPSNDFLCFHLGPLEFNTTDYSGGIPPLMLRPYPWTKVKFVYIIHLQFHNIVLSPLNWRLYIYMGWFWQSASIIFFDTPVNTGHSYATTTNLTISEKISARQTYEFIRKVKVGLNYCLIQCCKNKTCYWIKTTIQYLMILLWLN